MRETARAEGRAVLYDGRWRDRDPGEAPPGVPPVVRFKAPRDGETVIADAVQGDVRVPNAQLDDMVLLMPIEAWRFSQQTPRLSASSMLQGATLEHGASKDSITRTFGGRGATDNNREHPPLIKTAMVGVPVESTPSTSSCWRPSRSRSSRSPR